MSKRDFSFLVIGAVAALGLAYGVLHFPSAEVPEVVEAPEVAEVPSEPTVADIDAERMKLESDQAFLRSEMASMGLILGEEIDGTWSEFLLPCKALQDEYELLQRRLDQLPRERVQAQLRERERE